MSDESTPFEEGTAFEAQDGRIWEVTGLSREYTVTIKESPDADEVDERAIYPEDTIIAKVERGELDFHLNEQPTREELIEMGADEVADVVGEADGQDEEDTPDEHVCDECGAAFDTSQALGGHRSIHSEN